MAENNEDGALERLYSVIQARRGTDPELSYTASLLAKGDHKIAQKLGEEAIETVIAAAAGERAHLVVESADLLYHLLVVWANAGVRPEEIWAELARREAVSGHAEKRSRLSTEAPSGDDHEL